MKPITSHLCCFFRRFSPKVSRTGYFLIIFPNASPEDQYELHFVYFPSSKVGSGVVVVKHASETPQHDPEINKSAAVFRPRALRETPFINLILDSVYTRPLSVKSLCNVSRRTLNIFVKILSCEILKASPVSEP